MEIFDIVCGICRGHDWKQEDKGIVCQGCGHVLTDTEITKLLKSATAGEVMKIFSDDYFTIVAESKEQAEQFYEEVIGELDDGVELEEVDRSIKTMLYPVDKLPEQYHDESKYPREEWANEYIGVKITLNEAMKFRKEEPPYILSVSSDVL